MKRHGGTRTGPGADECRLLLMPRLFEAAYENSGILGRYFVEFGTKVRNSGILGSYFWKNRAKT
ncbi:hypothetical protein D1872_272580 [compost metagenome]